MLLQLIWSKFDLITLLICTLLFYYIKYLWDRRWLYYYGFKMCGPTPAWPLIGNALYFTGGTADILSTSKMLFTKFKTPARCWVGTQLFIGISQPKDIEIVMNKALDKHDFYKFSSCIAGQGLFSAPVPLWKAHRKIITPSFNQKILNGFVQIFIEQAEILVEQAEKLVGQGRFNAEKILNSCSIDILCESVLGYKIQTQTTDHHLEHDLNKCTEIVFQRMFQIWLHPDLIFNLTTMKRELDSCGDNVKQFIAKIITEKKLDYKRRKQAVERNEDYDCKIRGNKTFLDFIIELSEEEGNWSNQEILDEVATILIAGSDSTASTDGFILMMLGMHPEIQDKIYEELQQILAGSNRRFTHQDLIKMNYLERVIKETLRLFPAGPFIARTVKEDIRLEHHVLPKDSNLLIGIIMVHMDPEIWPEPEKFDPDRFLPQEIAKRHPYSYLPFSAGPRNCIGMRYGMMAMKSVISTFLRRYKVSTPYKKTGDIGLRQDLLLKATNGYLIELELR